MGEGIDMTCPIAFFGKFGPDWARSPKKLADGKDFDKGLFMSELDAEMYSCAEEVQER